MIMIKTALVKHSKDVSFIIALDFFLNQYILMLSFVYVSHCLD